MTNKYKLISWITALLGLCCLTLAVRGFIEERQAGQEYETLFKSSETQEKETQESLVTEAYTEATESSSVENTETTESEEWAENTETTMVSNPDFQTREDLDFEKLQNRNSDIYAWIEVPGTKVDYPIVQHLNDNTYYLTRTIDHEKKTAASIFTETYNTKDFEDHHTVIYGHNMKNGSMFKTLHYFEDPEFFEENREVIIYLPNQTRYYRIFAAYTYDNRHLLNNYYCEDPDIFQSYLDEVFAIRDFGANIDREMEITAEDHIITLSTCVDSGDSTQRYLVQAVLVSIDQ